MLEPLFLSIVLVAIIVLIHAFGTHHWMRFMRWRFVGANGNFKRGVEYSELAFLSLTGTLGCELTNQWPIGGGPIFMYTDSTSQARINNL